MDDTKADTWIKHHILPVSLAVIISICYHFYGQNPDHDYLFLTRGRVSWAKSVLPIISPSTWWGGIDRMDDFEGYDRNTSDRRGLGRQGVGTRRGGYPGQQYHYNTYAMRYRLLGTFH